MHFTFFNDCQMLSSNKGHTNLCSQLLCKCFPTLSPALDITMIFNLCQSNRWKRISSYYFNVYFFIYEWQMFIGHVWGVTAKCLFLSFFVFLLLISKTYLNMMEIGLLSVTCIVNFFQFAFFLLNIFMVYLSHINISIFCVVNFIIILLLCKICILYHTKGLISKNIFKTVSVFPWAFLWFHFLFLTKYFIYLN